MEAVYSTDMNTSVFAKMHLCKVYEKEKCFCNNNLNEQTLLSSKTDKAEMAWYVQRRDSGYIGQRMLNRQQSCRKKRGRLKDKIHGYSEGERAEGWCSRGIGWNVGRWFAVVTTKGGGGWTRRSRRWRWWLTFKINGCDGKQWINFQILLLTVCQIPIQFWIYFICSIFIFL